MKILFNLIVRITYFVFCISLFTACNSSKRINKDYVYFNLGQDTIATQQTETVIQPNDVISIQVFSRTLNQEQAAIFNQPNTISGATQGYQVDLAGNIDMPVIGTIKASGLTKDKLQIFLMQKLTENVKNPSVLVRFLQFNVNVLGEVRAPGTHKFLVDRVTIIDALSAAGDLTDYGKRENITVIRDENGKKIYHLIDLRSKNFFQSPVYNLQPNDIVYVSPNETKLKSLNVDPDVQRRTGLILTITSLLVSIGTLIVTVLR